MEVTAPCGCLALEIAEGLSPCVYNPDLRFLWPLSAFFWVRISRRAVCVKFSLYIPDIW